MLNPTIPYNPIPPTRSQPNQVLTGRRFNELQVIALYGRTKAKKLVWLCRCSCGQFTVVPAIHLKSGHTTSCGTHGIPGGRTSEYQAYVAAKHRCNNPKAQAFDHYGGRGIEFRFQSYKEFISALGNKPQPDYELDRIDNDGHYECGNVRWADRRTNSLNRRSTTAITIDGRTMCKLDWARESGTPIVNIAYRLAHGWCARCAVYNPADDVCSHTISER